MNFLRNKLLNYISELVGDSPSGVPDEDVSPDAYRRTKGRCPPGGHWDDKKQICYPPNAQDPKLPKPGMPSNAIPSTSGGDTDADLSHFVTFAQSLEQASGNSILDVADQNGIKYRMKPHKRSNGVGYTVHLVDTPFSFALPSQSPHQAANAYARISLLKAAIFLSDGYPQDSESIEQMIQEIEDASQSDMHHDSNPEFAGGSDESEDSEQSSEEDEDEDSDDDAYNSPDELSDVVPSSL